jgi:hypothetical protein
MAALSRAVDGVVLSPEVVDARRGEAIGAAWPTSGEGARARFLFAKIGVKGG